LKAVLVHVPAWYLWFQAFSFLDTEVRLLDPPRRDFAFTALFPLAWFAAYYLAVPWSDRTRNRRKDVLLVSLSCLVPAILILWVIPPTPRPHEVLMRGAEIARLVLSVLLAVHCWFATSRATFVKFFVVALLYGAILENGGILGGFFSEPGYLLYIPHLPAPLVNIVGWSVGLYISVYVWQRIFERFEFRRFKTAIFAAGVTAVAVSQDLQIDPFATHSHWWVWHESLPGAFLGVPLLNFLAWIAAVFPFAWLYYHIETRAGMTESRRIVRLFLSIPIVLVAGVVIVLILTVIFRGSRSADIELFKHALGLSRGLA
jgi:uncharacterized membrane protein